MKQISAYVLIGLVALLACLSMSLKQQKTRRRLQVQTSRVVPAPPSSSRPPVRGTTPSRFETFAALLLWAISAVLAICLFHTWKHGRETSSRIDKLVAENAKLENLFECLLAEIAEKQQASGEYAALRLQVAELALQARNLRQDMLRVEESSSSSRPQASSAFSLVSTVAHSPWYPLRLLGRAELTAGEARPECSNVGERVYLRGCLRLPTVNPAEKEAIIAELPLGSRPATADKFFVVPTDGAPLSLRISSGSGSLVLRLDPTRTTYPFIFLDNISFERGSVYSAF